MGSVISSNSEEQFSVLLIQWGGDRLTEVRQLLRGHPASKWVRRSQRGGLSHTPPHISTPYCLSVTYTRGVAVGRPCFQLAHSLLGCTGGNRGATAPLSCLWGLQILAEKRLEAEIRDHQALYAFMPSCEINPEQTVQSRGSRRMLPEPAASGTLLEMQIFEPYADLLNRKR